jgi:hypothetical protein
VRSFAGKVKYFSLVRKSGLALGLAQLVISREQGPFSLGLKRPRCEAAYLHAPSAYVKNKCSPP